MTMIQKTHTEREFRLIKDVVAIFARGSVGKITDPEKVDRMTYSIFRELCQRRHVGEAA